MTPLFITVVIGLVIAQLALPRKYAFLPLLIAGCHLGNGDVIGELSICRILIILGLTRAYAGGYFVWSKNSKLDLLFLFFSVWLILSSFGHKSTPFNPWTFRLGWVFNIFGSYLYGRAYLQDFSSFLRLAYSLPILLLPLGIGMTLEHASGKNVYYTLGAGELYSPVRDGKVRAQGPFRGPILAGSAGVATLPLAYLLWRRKKRIPGLLGYFACLSMIVACASSGPMAAIVITIAAAFLWRWRERLYLVRRAAIAIGLAYWILAGRGPWYIMARLDLVGGSTGWHRAKLFDQGYVYLHEWWLYGSDYTRHWMSTGVSWSPDHVDLTNYYLHLGVTAGLPVTAALVAMLVVCFKMIGKRMVELRHLGDKDEIVLWCAGTVLATHATSFVSISYYDQLYVLFYVFMGSIQGLVKVPPTGTDGESPTNIKTKGPESALGPSAKPA